MGLTLNTVNFADPESATDCHCEATDLEFSVCKSRGRRPPFTSRQFLTDVGCIKAQRVLVGRTQRTMPRAVVARKARNRRHVTRKMIDARTVVTAQQVTAVTTHCAVVFVWVDTRHGLLRTVLDVV